MNRHFGVTIFSVEEQKQHEAESIKQRMFIRSLNCPTAVNFFLKESALCHPQHACFLA
jgi:hypothetical protein